MFTKINRYNVKINLFILFFAIHHIVLINFAISNENNIKDIKNVPIATNVGEKEHEAIKDSVQDVHFNQDINKDKYTTTVKNIKGESENLVINIYFEKDKNNKEINDKEKSIKMNKELENIKVKQPLQNEKTNNLIKKIEKSQNKTAYIISPLNKTSDKCDCCDKCDVKEKINKKLKNKLSVNCEKCFVKVKVKNLSKKKKIYSPATIKRNKLISDNNPNPNKRLNNFNDIIPIHKHSQEDSKLSTEMPYKEPMKNKNINNKDDRVIYIVDNAYYTGCSYKNNNCNNYDRLINNVDNKTDKTTKNNIKNSQSNQLNNNEINYPKQMVQKSFLNEDNNDKKLMALLNNENNYNINNNEDEVNYSFDIEK